MTCWFKHDKLNLGWAQVIPYAGACGLLGGRGRRRWRSGHDALLLWA